MIIIIIIKILQKNFFVIVSYILSSFYFDSLDSKRNCFIHKSNFTGMNFPADGPVVQKRTTNWEPSVEKMTVSEGILKGDVTMFLSLKDGKKHRCQFHTLYKYVFKFLSQSNNIIERRRWRSKRHLKSDFTFIVSLLRFTFLAF